ncbi:MAG: hypothetical protein ACYDCK_10985 [Thermoplasmatota archaeon]
MKALALLALALLAAPMTVNAASLGSDVAAATPHVPLGAPVAENSQRACSTTVCAIAIALASPACSTWTSFDAWGVAIAKTAQCTAVGTVGGGGAPASFPSLPGYYQWHGTVTSSGDVTGSADRDGSGQWGALFGGAVSDEQTATVGTASATRVPFFNVCERVNVDAYSSTSAESWIPPTSNLQGLALEHKYVDHDDERSGTACVTW